MNANSKPPAPVTINGWLRDAAALLAGAGISSARLDTELILAHALRVERTWLIAHSDENLPTALARRSTPSSEDSKSVVQPEKSSSRRETLSSEERGRKGARIFADQLLKRRLNREPLAYIIGYKEFYGRNFNVTPDVLIPRPDTEILIEQLLPLVQPGMKLLDVGTGSGAIAVTAACEHPSLQVAACDVSQAALSVAAQNAHALGADVELFASDLLAAANDRYDLITANLPYVDQKWQRSVETESEPALALFADDEGLALIKRCTEQAPGHLTTGGFLLLEADPRQHDAIIAFARGHDLHFYARQGFIVVLQYQS